MPDVYPNSMTVYIDTNCINARSNNNYLNNLELLRIEGKITIGKTDTLDTELQKGNGYPQGLNKSSNYIEAQGTFVLGSSRLGASVLGTSIDQLNLSKMLEILWGKKDISAYSENQIRDAMHITTSSKHGGTFFTTDETTLLSKADLIEREFNIKVRSPQQCLIEVKKKLKEGY